MRPSAAKRGYGPKWEKARKEHLRREPWCRNCAKRGRRSRASHVDHIIPHRGNRKLFWNRRNWQSLCTGCHNGPKQAEEKSGRIRGCDAEGNPIDPNHHWGNRA